MKRHTLSGDGYHPLINAKHLSHFSLYFCFYLANGPMEEFLGAFFALRGLTMTQFGLFRSLSTASFLLLPALVAALAVRSRKSLTALGGAGFLLGLLGGILAPLTGRFAPLVYAMAFAILLGRRLFNASLGSAMGFAVDRNLRAQYFAVRDLFLFGGDALGKLLAGLMLRSWGVDMGWSFFVLAGGFALCCILLAAMKRKGLLPHVMGEAPREKEPWWGQIRLLAKAFSHRNVRVLGAVNALTGLYTVAAANYAVTLGLQWNIDLSSMLFFGGGMTLVNAALSLLFARFADGQNRRRIYLMDCAMDLLPALLFAFAGNRWLFLLAYGLTRLKDSFAPISYAYVYDCFGEGDGFLCMGALATLENGLGIALPLVGGWFFDRSPSLLFLLGAGGVGLGFLFALYALPKGRE